MSIQVTFTNGTVRTYKTPDTVEIMIGAPSEFHKPGYDRTREYPPEFCKFGAVCTTVLASGQYVRTSEGVMQIETVEHVS